MVEPSVESEGGCGYGECGSNLGKQTQCEFVLVRAANFAIHRRSTCTHAGVVSVSPRSLPWVGLWSRCAMPVSSHVSSPTKRNIWCPHAC